MIKNVKPGDKIFLETENSDTKKEEIKEWTVTAIYAHHVMVIRGSRRRCVPYGDLVVQNMEYQIPELEALREEKGGRGREAERRERDKIRRCGNCVSYWERGKGSTREAGCLKGCNPGLKKLCKSHHGCALFEQKGDAI